ncbi:MAG: hypothetical protein ABI282_01090 [Candidatus Baltobacteraceae bacterium]
MGISLPHRNQFLTQALAASVALHIVIALFVPTIAWLQSAGPPVERLSFVHIVRIAIATPRPVVHRTAASAPQQAAVPRVTHSQPHVARVARTHKALVVSGPRAQAPLVAVAAPGAATVETGATGAPSSAPDEKVATAETRHDEGGYMPFGADIPVPVLDPNVARALAALNVHVTLTIVVDENGRTKTVAFDPPLDTHVENQMRAMLADAAWDPAVCGAGVACEGRTTIKL